MAGAKLAGAGDSIDFVVTLGSEGKRSNGRLERQTARGTVAIREIEGDDCSEVAEAIALSLALAVEPAQKKPVSPQPPTTDTAPEPASIVPAHQPEASRTGNEDAQKDRPPATPSKRSRWGLGAQARIATGIAPAPLPGGSLFVELDRRGEHFLPGSSFRGGLVFMLGSVQTDLGEVRYRSFAGRLEGCPLRVGGDALSASPCVSFDLGTLGVEGTGPVGSNDSALWATAGVAARLSWSATDVLGFEAELGGFAPFTRYRLESGDPPVEGYRTQPLGFSAGIGTTALLP